LFFMKEMLVGAVGIEPTTFGSKGRSVRSPNVHRDETSGDLLP